MSTPEPTATLLARMKAEAKEFAKANSVSYNATLERAAREYGFASWHEAVQLHKARGGQEPADEGVSLDLPIDPPLRAGFGDTPNEARSDEEIEQWWLRPFAVTLPDGRYEVRCLDGGSTDRPTLYGVAADLEAARELAASSLAKWREFLDRPVTTAAGDGRTLLTVDSLHPAIRRAVLASFDTLEGAQAWLDMWKYLVSTEPDLAQTKLARAREQARQAPPGWQPSEEEMQQVHAVLSRIAQLRSQPLGHAEAPHPLRADIQLCVDQGFVLAQLQEGGVGVWPRRGVWVLTLSVAGERALNLMEWHLRETGQK